MVVIEKDKVVIVVEKDKVVVITTEDGAEEEQRRDLSFVFGFGSKYET